MASPAAEGKKATVKPADEPSAKNRRGLSRPVIRWFLAFLGLCGVLGVDVYFIAQWTKGSRLQVPSTISATPSSTSTPKPPTEANPGVAEVPEMGISATPIFGEEGIDDETSPATPPKLKHFGTVQEAATASCSTASVDGLSRQIIDQVRCMNPNAFVPLPPRPNLVLEGRIFPYLESSARDHLLRVLDAHRDRTMTVRSVLRTVAQQYLVWRWAAGKRCGVQLATAPGDSNHETGRALDIADESQWRPSLESEDFHWLGAADNVHFDYKSHRASVLGAPDVLAFQRLWNRNHRDDLIVESGRYDQSTEQRLKKSPPSGFPLGPSCSNGGAARAASKKSRI